MKKSVFILLAFVSFSVTAQHNFLGNNQFFIEQYYKSNQNYYLRIDTLSADDILLTFKSLFQYPYYTYEIDLTTDNCVSFGLVSKDNDVLDAYFDMLNFSGRLVRKDTVNNNLVYEVKHDSKSRFYDIKQPYLNNKKSNSQSLFYILVRERQFELGDIK